MGRPDFQDSEVPDYLGSTTWAQQPGLNNLEMGPAKRHELVKIIVITIAPRV